MLIKCFSLPSARSCDSLSSHRFTHFTPSILTWFLKIFFHFETFEQTIILNLFLQNFHGFFNVIINDFDRNIFQIYRPFLAHHDSEDGLFLSNSFNRIVSAVQVKNGNEA